MLGIAYFMFWRGRDQGFNSRTILCPESNWLSSHLKDVKRQFRKRRRLPTFRPRLPFPRTDNFVGYPTAIEITRLRAHALAVDETLDAAGVKGKVICHTVVCGLRLRIAPSDGFRRQWRRCECPVLRRAFPFANRSAWKWLQQFDVDISWWHVESRRSRGLQDAISFTRVGDEQIAALYNDPPMVGNKFWRPRIIPNRLLSGSRCFGKRRPLMAGISPHAFLLGRLAHAPSKAETKTAC